MRQERNIQNKIQELITKHGIRINILETFTDIASGKEIKNRYKLEQNDKRERAVIYNKKDYKRYSITTLYGAFERGLYISN